MNTPKHHTTWALDAYTFALGEADAEGRIQAWQVAGPGARFLAGMVDLFIQAAVGIGFVTVVLHFRPDLFQIFRPNPWLIPVAMLEWHIIFYLLFEAFTWGRTPGKMLLRLRVVDRYRLDRPGSMQILTRNLLRVVDWLPLHYLLGLASALATPLRQRLGDRMARTVVVYQTSLLEQLALSGVPDSNYSTSDDGYLLEAFLKRYPQLEAERASFLARDLARYLHRKYPSGDAKLDRLFQLEKWHDYLLELYQVEMHASLDPAAGNEVSRAD